MAESRNSDLGITRKDWLPNTDLWIGLVLSTFIINILALAFPVAILQVYDRIVPNNAIDTLYLLALGVGLALFLETLLRIARSWVSAWADARNEHITSCRIFRRILDAKFGYFEEEGAGTQLDRLASLNTLKDFYGGQLITTLLDIPFVFIYIGLIWYLGGKIVIVTILSLVLLGIFTYVNGNYYREQLEGQRTADDRRMNFIIEVLGGIHTVKSLGLEAQMLRRYERLQESTASLGHGMTLISGGTSRVGMFLSQMTIILVVVYGSILIMAGDLTLGSLAACTLLSGRTIQPMNRAAGLWSRLQSVFVTKEHLQGLIDVPVEVVASAPKIGDVRGDLELRNMSFAYSEDGPMVLKEINLTIPYGQAIALDGMGYSGRSTLLNVLGGLLRPVEGEVLINGKNIYEHDIQDYRRNIGYLPEEGHLFEGTIMENITMFREGKYLSRALDIAEFVGLNNVIEHMQEGYFTKVGQGTVEAVPRGIKQRIAIARALINHPPIVLFDEANTALDIQADELLRKAMLSLKGQCILIIVSHRPSTKKIADQVYLLKDGELMSDKV